jgi:hypothetical protein
VILELKISTEGNVIGSKVLMDQPGFGDFVDAAARQWKFSPAKERGKAVEGIAVVAISFVEPY